MTYKKGESVSHRSDESSTDSAAYTDALALFGDGSSTVTPAEDQSLRYDGVTASQTQHDPTVEDESSTTREMAFTWIHHTDGYHYKQLADGSFEPTAHTKNEDGTYVPYG